MDRFIEKGGVVSVYGLFESGLSAFLLGEKSQKGEHTGIKSCSDYCGDESICTGEQRVGEVCLVTELNQGFSRVAQSRSSCFGEHCNVVFLNQLFVLLHFSGVGEACKYRELFVFVVDVVHCEELFCGSGIFAEQVFQFVQKSDCSECDVFFISEGSGNEVEHRES
jgi:hypothetical protein